MKWYLMLILVLLCGCLGINTTRKLEKKTTRVFSNRLEGKNTGLSSKVDLHGYFSYWETRNSHGIMYPPGDTFFLNLILYEDGTSVYNFFKAPGFESYDSYFASIIQKGKNGLFYKGLGWGVYQLSGDTIKMQQVSHASNLTARFTYERWFLIEDRHTLRLFAQGPLGAVSRASAAEEDKYAFHPLSVIPPAIPWLKKEKFFWSNASDWEQYMQMIKTHK